ncbi:C40 family peptidase [Vibrio tapetis]|uniref:Putative endopeptidase NlpC homolog n=1 Tax=Vibrio tapetis subsp. tapetis TaxID=1671868 RepID=A0A2N8Z9V4_9VIBR|nr:NlpC/P60 family protein [Vibrio tapetis]SON48680.1 putative endopeptidase NlpC homolog [Vibrio tapetis subsp. tapetis]
MNNQLFTTISIIGVIWFLNGCSNTPENSSYANSTGSFPTVQTDHAMKKIYNEWNGVPYRWGGTNKSGIDCSAFTQIVMLEYSQTNLPRTTHQQVNVGSKVAYSKAKVGDLVFFKVSRKQNHVGVYIGGNEFMHASTSKGVIISRLDNPYWADAFWHFRRVN